MNVCEICGADFPNITEFYRHIHSTHEKSLVLHNHKPENSLNIGPFRSNSDPDLNLKRKRDDIDSQDVKRYRALPEPSRKLVPAVRPRRQKPKRTFYQGAVHKGRPQKGGWGSLSKADVCGRGEGGGLDECGRPHF